MIWQVLPQEAFYIYFFYILVSFFCGFLIGIERTRVEAQYGARDHIFFSIISTSLIILYENYLSEFAVALILVIFGGMISFLLIGSVYRLFKTKDPGYTTTLSMLLAMIVGILSYYIYFLAITISVIFLIILSTKKQFYKIRKLQQIEWTGTVEFIAIVVLLYFLIPDTLMIGNINLKSIIIIFILILALKYASYFLLRSSTEHNLYYISFLGGLAHSEATTDELAEAGASSASIWLVIQTMLIRMLLVLVIAPDLLFYAIFPIIITAFVGLIGSFLILRNKQTSLSLEKIKNPLSIRSSLVFAGTYSLALIITLILEFYRLNFIAYIFIAFSIGLLSGGASSLFVATAYLGLLVNRDEALILLTIGLTAAIVNKIFYSLNSLNESKNKKKYCKNLITYQGITISLLTITTFIIILLF
jgi:MFS family permease